MRWLTVLILTLTSCLDTAPGSDIGLDAVICPDHEPPELTTPDVHWPSDAESGVIYLWFSEPVTGSEDNIDLTVIQGDGSLYGLQSVDASTWIVGIAPLSPGDKYFLTVGDFMDGCGNHLPETSISVIVLENE